MLHDQYLKEKKGEKQLFIYEIYENSVIGRVLSFTKKRDNDSSIAHHSTIIEDSVPPERTLEIATRAACLKNHIHELSL